VRGRLQSRPAPHRRVGQTQAGPPRPVRWERAGVRATFSERRSIKQPVPSHRSRPVPSFRSRPRRAKNRLLPCAAPQDDQSRPVSRVPSRSRGGGGGSTTLVGQLPIETKCPDPATQRTEFHQRLVVGIKLRTGGNRGNGGGASTDLYCPQFPPVQILVRASSACRGSFLPLVKKDPHHQQIYFLSPAGSLSPPANLFPPPVRCPTSGGARFKRVSPSPPSHLGEDRGEGQIGISNHKGWFKSLSEIRWQNLPPF
jgi:hypothetical protein